VPFKQDINRDDSGNQTFIARDSRIGQVSALTYLPVRGHRSADPESSRPSLVEVLGM
jgi:hypothetical protein